MMMVQAPRAAQKFTIEQSAFELWRLSDMEYRVLRECSFPIRQMGTAVLGLQLADRRAGRRLMLPKLLVLLEEDYGAASACIDNWKQTFSFPFLIKFTKGDESWPYLLRLDDFRGGLEFNFYRVVNDEKYAEVRRDAYQEPITGELDEAGMKYWISYLWGYLYAVSERLCEQKVKRNELSPYFRHIDSNHIIYGFVDGEFFQYQIEDEKEYDAEVAKLRQQCPEVEPALAEELAATQALVETIWQTSDAVTV